MAGWIMTESANYSTDIHRNSGVFTIGNTLCPGAPNECRANYSYHVSAKIEEDLTNFDDLSSVIRDSDIEQVISSKGCNCDGLFMWYNYRPPTTSIRILDDNSIFDMKNVDECNHIVFGTLKTGRHVFGYGSYIESGYPSVGRTTGSTQGHKIMYRPTSSTIPDNFFTDATDLQELYFPHMLANDANSGYNTKVIGNGAFSGCTKLSAITLSAVETIGNSAFKNCTGLTKIDWGHNACGFTSKVITIGNNAFEECTSLTSLNIPSSVKTIGTSAFEGCTAITNCIIGNSVTSIGNRAFFNCNGLSSINIPDSVKTIGGNCFFTCVSLTSCTIGTGVTSIGGNAFSLSPINELTCKAIEPPLISSTTFERTGLSAIYVPSESVNRYKTASEWSNYSSIIYPIT